MEVFTFSVIQIYNINHCSLANILYPTFVISFTDRTCIVRSRGVMSMIAIIPGYKLLPLIVETKSSRSEEEKDCDIDINGSDTD